MPSEARIWERSVVEDAEEIVADADEHEPAARARITASLGTSVGIITGLLAGAAVWIAAFVVFLNVR